MSQGAKEMVRKAKVQAEVNLAKDVKGKKTEGSLGISVIKDRLGKM